MLVSGSSCFFGVCALASMSVGRFCALPVDAHSHSSWSAHLRCLEPKMVFVEQTLLEPLQAALKQAKVTATVIVAPTHFLSEEERFERVEEYETLIGDVSIGNNVHEEVRRVRRQIDPHECVAYVQLTSGTTSNAKACGITHAECLSELSARLVIIRHKKIMREPRYFRILIDVC